VFLFNFLIYPQNKITIIQVKFIAKETLCTWYVFNVIIWSWLLYCLSILFTCCINVSLILFDFVIFNKWPFSIQLWIQVLLNAQPSNRAQRFGLYHKVHFLIYPQNKITIIQVKFIAKETLCTHACAAFNWVFAWREFVQVTVGL
jgi:hypothetical protein